MSFPLTNKRRENQFYLTRTSSQRTLLKVPVLVLVWVLSFAIGDTSLSADTPTSKLHIPPWTTADFYDAIDKNDVKSVQDYLSDTKRATKEFLSCYLLDYALELERDDIAELMVEAGAGIDTLSAVQFENVPILEAMLKRGVKPLGASLAAERGNVDILQILLDHGEDELSTEGAVKYGQLETLKLLIDHGADPEGLEIAILHGHEDVAELLLDSGADPNEITRLSLGDFSDVEFPPKYKFEYLSPLHYAVLKQSKKLVKVLLEAGANPNVVPKPITLLKSRYDSTPWPTVLKAAQDSEWGDTSIAQMLKENGAILTVSDSNEEYQLELKLHDAADQWDYEEVVRLLELGAVPTGFGDFYYELSEPYDPRVMQAFVEAGADPDVFNEFPAMLLYTPTAITLWNEDVENFKRFIDAGADVNDSLLSWYLKIALGRGLTEAIEILVRLKQERHGVYVGALCNLGYLRTVETLLAKGARPEGLRRAVKNEHVQIVKLLLEAGADPDQPHEFDERTILEVAVESDNQYIISMLTKAGASE
ncbi:MAG: hypothetical protein F4Z01_06300 [Gammaproteobacteria bacterium]|nr:hypothetical protein [Gammaproteobacteria bacterium]